MQMDPRPQDSRDRMHRIEVMSDTMSAVASICSLEWEAAEAEGLLPLSFSADPVAANVSRMMFAALF